MIDRVAPADDGAVRIPAPADAAPSDEPVDRFVALFADSLVQHAFVKLVLAKHHGGPPDLRRLDVRPVLLRDGPALSFVYHHATRDLTRNLSPGDAVTLLRGLLGGAAGDGFRHAHLSTTAQQVELRSSRRGHATLRVAAVATSDCAETAAGEDCNDRDRLPPDGGAMRAGDSADPLAAAQPHDRAKRRHVELTRPFLAELGVTTTQHQLVPALARKYRQIDKFVEVFAGALAASPLAVGAVPSVAARPIRVVDFGAGKGYLTFAVHDHLGRTAAAHGRGAQVTGVELRLDLVDAGNASAARLGLAGLRFEQGDLRRHSRLDVATAFDVVIALHACDTATDHAIHLGVRAGAAIVMCSPCCHQQIRPQLLKPHPLRPILQHGVHLAQQAEMLTDGLRALLLEACGYATQVFEFVSLEHTNKNKMILAVKRSAPPPQPADALLAQIDEIKRFYGIREHCLETLLRGDGRLPGISSSEHAAGR